MCGVDGGWHGKQGSITPDPHGSLMSIIFPSEIMHEPSTILCGAEWVGWEMGAANIVGVWSNGREALDAFKAKTIPQTDIHAQVVVEWTIYYRGKWYEQHY